MVIDVAEQEALRRAVHDKPQVEVDPHGPEVLVLRLVELVEAHAGGRGIHLQIERGRLDRLLLVAGQPCEAVGEGIGDSEIHYVSMLSSCARVRFCTCRHEGKVEQPQKYPRSPSRRS